MGRRPKGSSKMNWSLWEKRCGWRENWQYLPTPLGLETVVREFLDPPQVNGNVEGLTRCLHMARKSSLWPRILMVPSGRISPTSPENNVLHTYNGCRSSWSRTSVKTIPRKNLGPINIKQKLKWKQHKSKNNQKWSKNKRQTLKKSLLLNVNRPLNVYFQLFISKILGETRVIFQ